MKRIHACLLGEWVDITDEGTIDDHRNPKDWLASDGLERLFKYDYVNIQYKGMNYRIHPSFVQVTNG